MKKIILSLIIMLVLAASAFALIPIGSIFDGGIGGRAVSFFPPTTYEPQISPPNNLPVDVSSPDIGRATFTNTPIDSRILVGDSRCTLKKTSTPFYVYPGGTVEDGRFLLSGAQCSTGQYLQFEEMTSYANNNLFADLWYKSSSTDLLYWSDYGSVNNLPRFIARYICYDCDIVSDTYTCEDSDGLDYANQGTTTLYLNGRYEDSLDDFCRTDKILAEAWCDDEVKGGVLGFVQYTCPGSCENGVCVDPTTCTSTCTIDNNLRCNNNNLQYCTKQKNGCFEYQTMFSCSSGAICDVATQTCKSIHPVEDPTTSVIEYTVTKYELADDKSYVKAFITVKNTGDQNAQGLLSLELDTQSEIDSRGALISSVEQVQCALSEDGQAKIILAAGDTRSFEITAIPEFNKEYVDIRVQAVPICFNDMSRDVENEMFNNLGNQAWFDYDELIASSSASYDASKLLNVERKDSLNVRTFIPLPFKRGGTLFDTECIWLDGYTQISLFKRLTTTAEQGYLLCHNDELQSCSCTGPNTEDCSWVKVGCSLGLFCTDKTIQGDASCEEEYTGWCGDNITVIALGEECDDGNTVSGDGCSDECKIEKEEEEEPPITDCIETGKFNFPFKICCSGCKESALFNDCIKSAYCVLNKESEDGYSPDKEEGADFQFIEKDEDTWCIKNKQTNNEECYPRKESITFSDLPDLKNIKENPTNPGLINVDDNPICIVELGNAQCKPEGEFVGHCVAAKNEDRSIFADNKLIYDTIKPLIFNAQDLGSLFSNIILSSTDWVFGTEFKEDVVEEFGVCILQIEKENFFDSIKSFVGKLFGWNPDDPKVTIAIIVGIVGIISIILIISQPPRR